jgi:hypothetical protein
MSTRDCAANRGVNALIVVQIRDLTAAFAQALVQPLGLVQPTDKKCCTNDAILVRII